MRGFKRAVFALIVFVITVAILTFVLENQQGVSLSFLGWSTSQVPVSVFVVLALLVGMIVGPLLGLLFGRKVGRASRTLES